MTNTQTKDGEYVLETAISLITGERNRTYGPPTPFAETAALIAAPLTGLEITAVHIMQIMLAVKLARLRQSPMHEDSAIDAAAYAALTFQVAKTQSQEQLQELGARADELAEKLAKTTPTVTWQSGEAKPVAKMEWKSVESAAVKAGPSANKYDDDFAKPENVFTEYGGAV